MYLYSICTSITLVDIFVFRRAPKPVSLWRDYLRLLQLHRAFSDLRVGSWSHFDLPNSWQISQFPASHAAMWSKFLLQKPWFSRNYCLLLGGKLWNKHQLYHMSGSPKRKKRRYPMKYGTSGANFPRKKTCHLWMENYTLLSRRWFQWSLFSPWPGKMIQFDINLTNMFCIWVDSTT